VISLYRRVSKAVSLVAPKQRTNFLYCLTLLLIVSFLELLGLNFLFWLLQALSEPGLRLFGISSISFNFEFPVVELSIWILFLFSLKAAAELLVTFLESRISNNSRVEISSKLLNHYLLMPYDDYVRRHTSSYTRTLLGDISHATDGGIRSTLAMLHHGALSAAILLYLVFISPLFVLVLLTFLGLGLLFHRTLFQSRFDRIGLSIHTEGHEIQRRVSEGFANFVDLKVFSSEQHFSKGIMSMVSEFNRLTAQYEVLRLVPKVVYETLGICAIIALVLASYLGGVTELLDLSVIGVFSIGVLRLIPSLNAFSGAIAYLGYSEAHVNRVCEDYESSKRDFRPSASSLVSRLDVRKALTISDLSFSYDGQKQILSRFNAVFVAGSTTLLVGPSGSGKSTLLAIIIGLLKQSEGRILVDGRDLVFPRDKEQLNFGYVPQRFSLFDASVKENVSFLSNPSKDQEDRVWRSLKAAGLDARVQAAPGGLDSRIGERGLRLSGGEVQRLAIARALYRNPSLLILDEATNSLDKETEDLIFRDLNKLSRDVTKLVVSHDDSVRKYCDQVVHLV